MSFSVNFGTIKPSLNLDFANTKALDPRVTFTRASAARYYDGVTTAKAEENLVTYSQEFDNAAWTKTNVTVTANATTAPDGTSTAEQLIETVVNSNHFIANAANVYAAGTYVGSIYVKPNGRTWILLTVIGGNDFFCYFDLTGSGAVGTAGSGTTGQIQALADGWYRCVVTKTFSGTTASGSFTVSIVTADGGGGYTGNGTSGVFLWGAQLEQRSAVTAYTATTTQPITNYIPVLLAAQAGVPRFDHNPTTGVSLGLLIEEQRANLLLYSEQFDDAYWTKTRTTITSNTNIAPSGALTADAFYDVTGSGGQSAIQRAVTTTAASHTFSVYAKYLNKQWIRLTTSLFSFGTTYFDLQNGVIGTVNANHTAAISSVGNGWYRISITFTATAAVNTFYIEGAAGNGVPTYTPVDGQGYFIWGAQLEVGAFPTSYIPTVASQVTRSADAASMTGVNFSSWYRADEGTLYIDTSSGSSDSSAASARISDGTVNNRIQAGISTGAVGFSGRVTTNGVTQVELGTIVANNTNYKNALAYKVNDFAVSLNGTAVLTDTSGVLPIVNTLTLLGVANPIKKIAYYPLRLTNAQLQALTTV
jgi:hypothetical protein